MESCSDCTNSTAKEKDSGECRTAGRVPRAGGGARTVDRAGYIAAGVGRHGPVEDGPAEGPVESEEHSPDLTTFTFVSLQGSLEEVTDPAHQRRVRRVRVRIRELGSRHGPVQTPAHRGAEGGA